MLLLGVARKYWGIRWDNSEDFLILEQVEPLNNLRKKSVEAHAMNNNRLTLLQDRHELRDRFGIGVGDDIHCDIRMIAVVQGLVFNTTETCRVSLDLLSDNGHSLILCLSFFFGFNFLLSFGSKETLDGSNSL